MPCNIILMVKWKHVCFKLDLKKFLAVITSNWVFLVCNLSIHGFLSGLNGLTSITRLNLAYNQINDLTGGLDCITVSVNSWVVCFCCLNYLTFKIRNATNIKKSGVGIFLYSYVYQSFIYLIRNTSLSDKGSTLPVSS